MIPRQRVIDTVEERKPRASGDDPFGRGVRVEAEE